MNRPEFISSNEICDIMQFTKRTLQRRLNCPKNPLPPADLSRVGGKSMWDRKIFEIWLERERALSQKNRGGDQ